MKFIDLFAGLGGFHKALSELGHDCVYASEIEPRLQELYKENWGIMPSGDIKDIVENNIDSIPKHDILCAGFPCQPFSKAGKQEGMMDIDRGTLFDEIVKIIKHRHPKYFILENVPFIQNHNNKSTWDYIVKRLERKLSNGLRYEIDHKEYSPHQFGIPQHRKRIFIVGCLKGLDHFSFDEIDKFKANPLDIRQFIDENPEGARKVPKRYMECLNLWQEFIDNIPSEVKLPGFPIWGMEFGATYTFEDVVPIYMRVGDLGKQKGNFGISLKNLTKKEQLKLLPSYARTKRKFPDWKKKWIIQNRNFYKENKKYVESVVREIAKLPSQSWQKLEWNVGNAERVISNYILQFRASGIRIKKADCFPSLVVPSTQIPIIGWQSRYITKEEGLKLQSLEGLKLFDNENESFQALGNAVNANLVRMIAENLIKQKKPIMPSLNGAIINGGAIAHTNHQSIEITHLETA
jgi:DNA (cytosine-5)-methyltransferase 1